MVSRHIETCGFLPSFRDHSVVQIVRSVIRQGRQRAHRFGDYMGRWPGGRMSGMPSVVQPVLRAPTVSSKSDPQGTYVKMRRRSAQQAYDGISREVIENGRRDCTSGMQDAARSQGNEGLLWANRPSVPHCDLASTTEYPENSLKTNGRAKTVRLRRRMSQFYSSQPESVRNATTKRPNCPCR